MSHRTFSSNATQPFKSNTYIGARMVIYRILRVPNSIAFGVDLVVRDGVRWVRQPPTTAAMLLVDRNAEPAPFLGNPKQTWSLALLWRRIFSLSLSRRIPDPSFSSSSFSAAFFFDAPPSEAVEPSSWLPGQLRGGIVSGSSSAAAGPGFPPGVGLTYQRVSELGRDDAAEGG